MRYIIISTIIIFAACNNEKKKSSESTELKKHAEVITPYGKMLFSLSDKTPNHKKHFIRLAESGYWDSLTFNRVINNFVIQGGCPDTPEGFNDPNYLIPPEFNDSLTHVYGALGIGRDDNTDKNSATCQFYIVHNKEGLHRLDGNYMIIGQLVQGQQVLDTLGRVPTDSLDSPLTAISMDVNIVKLSPSELK